MSLNKVKVSIECTPDERAYIKMLAAKSHTTLSNLVLSAFRPQFPDKKPNKETLKSINDGRAGRGTKCESLDDFWKKLGIDPDA